jgi:hypothetical protein
MGDMRNAYKILVRKTEGKRLLGKPGCRWVNHTKINLKGIGYGSIDLIHLDNDRDWWRAVVNTVMNIRVP